jgi:hypothetical protein
MLALMDENGVRRSLVDYLSGRANRPFGDVESVSGRTLQPFSFAGQRAAENLLAKARRALDDNDVDRASALVDRAIRLPFDEHEGAAPAALAVHMDLFCAVTDALERAEADDSRWLDAALDVLGGADGTSLRSARRAGGHRSRLLAEPTRTRANPGRDRVDPGPCGAARSRCDRVGVVRARHVHPRRASRLR